MAAPVRRKAIRLNRRPIGDVAEPRLLLSDNPGWFMTCMNRVIVDFERGEDPATAGWTAVDPIKCAAEIEALAGIRRLAHFRELPRV
ncbi:hypothetical protein [Streptomyces sp. 2P-4]|uniref:hypothetical protein n=1 Tax=Streptomyces sp. 2P-4 TaxID=2931974 RepID=UPI002540708E|nr:hypothetical protein [Streptomyces sp. 2P-4]